MSEVNTAKVSGRNGYEIRADLLELAQKHVMEQYYSEIARLKLDFGVDPEHGTVLFDGDLPAVPTVSDVLEAAHQFYSFVNQPKK